MCLAAFFPSWEHKKCLGGSAQGFISCRALSPVGAIGDAAGRKHVNLITSWSICFLIHALWHPQVFYDWYCRACFFLPHLFSVCGTVAHEWACSLLFNLLTTLALPASCGNKFQKSANCWTILILKKCSSVTVGGCSLVPLLQGLENNHSPIRYPPPW